MFSATSSSVFRQIAVVLPNLNRRSADCFAVKSLAQKASNHAVRHSVTSGEFQIWTQMARGYSEAVAGHVCTPPASGWFPWNW